MAWTQLGGKLLTVEAILYRSEKQKIDVTGQLGDVMKESVNIAFSWIKSNFDELAIVDGLNQQLSGIEKMKYLDEVSLHIHFPEGATKKDGPSAGVTIVTCLASLLMKTAPRQNLSMTG
jgi:ATP-dependent Lon protease